jgi:predicted  nucleic acid-binding Zn-ribbon protein
MSMEMPWIEHLEERVRQAAAEIGRLREENRRLENLLAAASTPGDAGESVWRQEREEVRQRVERLAGQLESLLGEDG